jgi:peptide-methionine (R)-S-oxide reductase
MTVDASDDWKNKLTPEQFKVLREKGTETPFSGQLLFNDKKGVYRCAACGQPIFESTTKFDSGTGWPSFYDAIKGSVALNEDDSFGMNRIEVSCSNCGSHLGHVFGGFSEVPTGKDFCINSVALNFVPAKSKPEGNQQ